MIAGSHGPRKAFCRAGINQRHGASSEAGAGHARTQAAGHTLGAPDHDIELTAGNLEVVAQAGVAGIHQPAQLGGVALTHGFGRGQSTRVR